MCHNLGIRDSCWMLDVKLKYKTSDFVSGKIVVERQTGGFTNWGSHIACLRSHIITGSNVAYKHNAHLFLSSPGLPPCLLQRSESRWGAKPCTLRSPCTRPSSSQTTPSCRPSTRSQLTSCRGCTASARCKPCTWTTGLLVTRTFKDWGRRSRRWQLRRVWSTPGFPSQRYPSQPQRSSFIQNRQPWGTASRCCTRTGRGLTSPTWPSLPLRRTRRRLRIWRSWRRG